jgi:branched-chain amino acid transport system permease protein
MFILAIFVIGFNWAFGFTNLPSFGHAIFFGAGAYGFVFGLKYAPGSLIVPIVATLLLTLVVGIIVGAVSLRGQGIYFALLTFIFSMVAFEFTRRFSDITGGSSGMPISFTNLPFERTLITQPNTYYLALAILVLTYFIAKRIVNSPYGKVLQAIRTNQERTNAIGFPVYRVQLSVFVISGLIGGVAGALQALNMQMAYPGLLSLQTILDALLISIIGGSVTLVGPIIGVGFLFVVWELVVQDSVGLVITAVVLILAIYYMPQGIVGYVQDRFIRDGD